MKKIILDLIPYGKENAVQRSTLVAMTGLNERAVRRAIEKLRADGEPIISSSYSSGYWRSDSLEEIQEYLRESDSRCRKLFLTNRKLKQRMYEMTGQRYTRVREHIRKVV